MDPAGTWTVALGEAVAVGVAVGAGAAITAGAALGCGVGAGVAVGVAIGWAAPETSFRWTILRGRLVTSVPTDTVVLSRVEDTVRRSPPLSTRVLPNMSAVTMVSRWTPPV